MKKRGLWVLIILFASLITAGCEGTPVKVTRASTAEKITRNLYPDSQPTYTPPPPDHQVRPATTVSSIGQERVHATYVPLPQSLPEQYNLNERRLALVIGNSAYPSGGYLKNPVNDARAIANALKKIGFEVIQELNADQKQMKKTINNFGSKLRGYEIGLFYYAGHGIQIDGLNYLIPIDAELIDEGQVEYDSVEAGKILASMENTGCRVNIVILDACRDNPFERSFTRGIRRKGLAPMNPPTGSLVAYSTSPGSTAADGEKGNGLYTSVLLKYLNTPNLPIEDIFKKVRVDVISMSNNQQIPWELSKLTGNFYFRIER